MKALVLDFDGLMVDTETPMLAAWVAEWRHHGLELDVSTFWATHGGDMTSARYEQLAAAVGPTFNKGTVDVRRKASRDAMLAEATLQPGILAWLDEADALGVRLAVASSSPRTWVLPLLDQLGVRQRFEVIACGDEVGAPKPDPGVYLLALARLGLAGADAVAVEDAPHGFTAAQAAGMRCVAIPSPHVSRDALGHADLVLASAGDLPFTALKTYFS